MSDRFATRLLGRFRVVGRDEPVAIYEVLGPVVTNYVQTTMETFAQAVEAFRLGNFAVARTLMEQTRAHLNGRDGPSEYYLQKIEQLEQSGLPADWDGVIKLSEK